MVEDGFGLVVVMVVDYATGLLSYKDNIFPRGAGARGGLGGAWVKCDGGCGEII